MSAAFPDTRLVTEARALAEQVVPVPVLNHSVRTFRLAAAYAAGRRIDFDAEGLAVAALFHDFGLCAGHADPTRPFTVASSRALRHFLEERDVAAERIERLVDAILFHMQVWPRWSKGPETGLLQIGAWMDVTGLRRWSVWREAAAIGREHPRAGFDLAFPIALAKHAWRPRACLGLLLPGTVRQKAE